MLRIAGLEKNSLIDYPGKISAILFTYGCNLRCPYCHNPELVVEKLSKEKIIPHSYIFEFLQKRVGKLDAVVITGGEPLIHVELETFIRDIKELGFLVKLDTNGFYPEELKSLIDKKLVDYVAMDVKYPKNKYIHLTEKDNSVERISQSIDIIMKSKLEYEFRTTYVKPFHNLKSAKEIGQMIKGANVYYIQNFRPGKTIDPLLSSKNSFTDTELEKIKEIILKYVKEVHIR